MSLRPPKNLSGSTSSDTMSVMHAEILQESAAALGHQGRKLEKALAALKAAAPDEQQELKLLAAEAAWGYFIQREICGLRDHSLIIKEMGVPQEILNLMGARRKTPQTKS